MYSWRPFLVVAMAAIACRGEARQAGTAQGELAALVDSLRVPVEKAVGLSFKTPPVSAMRSRDQVRAYLVAKLDDTVSPSRLL